MDLEGSSTYGNIFGGSVAIGGVGVNNWLWELFWWVCSYFWGWCDQMVMGVVLVGV